MSENQNRLGIYLRKDTATVVCLGFEDGRKKVLGCFSVSTSDDSVKVAELATLIVAGCAERGLRYGESAVALDCAMFMQHKIHTEFDNPRQIATTIKFDTEEALAMDIKDLATAYTILSKNDGEGSDLAVFTARQKTLSELISALQKNNIDPATVEPDINCLLEFVGVSFVPDKQEETTLFAILSKQNCYIFAFAGSHPVLPFVMRTFLIGQGDDRTALLAREVPMTLALTSSQRHISRLMVSDSEKSVNYQHLAGKTAIPVEQLDLATVEGSEQCDTAVDFAIACGAAMALSRAAPTANFRSEFLPYQGKKERLQKMIKVSMPWPASFCL